MFSESEYRALWLPLLCLLILSLTSLSAADDGDHSLTDGVTSTLLSWPAHPPLSSPSSFFRLSVTVQDDVHAPAALSATALLNSAFTPNTVTTLLIHTTTPHPTPFHTRYPTSPPPTSLTTAY